MYMGGAGVLSLWWAGPCQDVFSKILSLVAQRLKHLPAMRETGVQSLGWEDSPGAGNGNPLQYSSLENPMEGEAW